MALAAPPDQPLSAPGEPIDLRLGWLNQDAYLDLAAISADGTLTVATNRGDGTWQTASSVSLGLGPLHGMELALVNSDTILDLVVQGPDAITLLRNRVEDGWSVRQTLPSPVPGSFAPSDGGRVKFAITLLNDDLSFELAAPSPGTDEVVVYQGQNYSYLGAPVRYATGGDEPVAVVAGNFLGDTIPDLAIGHRDGVVTFLEGQAAGGFVLRSAATFSGLGTIHDVVTGDFNADGELDLAVTGGDRVTLLINNADPLPSPPIVNGDFSAGLTGWTAEVVGHAPGDTPGQVSALGGAAQFHENASFLVSLKQSFVVPPNPQSIAFDLVSLGLADPAGGIPDAFEASLLTASGASAVPTHRPGATSFLNLNPGGEVSSTTGVTFDGRHATVDISSLSPGSTVTLVFDLIGNPPGATSVAAIDNVSISPNVIRADTFSATRLAGLFTAAAGLATGDVDGDGHADLVVADRDANQLVLYMGDGQGGLTRETYDIAPFGDGPSAVAIGPLTAGDNIADVAVTLADSDLVLTPLDIDQIPPTATPVSPAPGQTVSAEVTNIVVEFSEAMLNVGATAPHSVTNPAAYSLYSAGPNGIFENGGGDDIATPLAEATHDAATRQVTVAIAAGSAPLADGAYEFRAEGDDADLALHDLAGNALGSDLVVPFSVNRLGPINLSAAAVSGAEGQFLTLTAAFDNPGSSGPHSATIDWGDGTDAEPAAVQFIGGQWQIAASHAYPDNGSYTIHVEASDDSLAGLVGPTAIDTTATVGNIAPTVAAQSDRRVSAGVSVSLLAATFTDPGFDNPLLGTFESFTATIDWGDGTPASTGSLAVVQGSAGALTSGEVTGTHNYATIGSFVVTVTVVDDDGGSAQVSFTITTGSKFAVVDDSSHELFRYDSEFDLLEHSDLAQHTNSPRGADANPAGDTFWVVNSSRDISAYDREGAFLGQWRAGDATQPQGIATDGTHLWLVGVANDRLYYYAEGAARRSGNTVATSWFELDTGNRNASGLATDGQRLWVTNDKAGEQKVFVYTISGTLLGSWRLDADNVQPSGIALDPVTGTLWVCDRHTGSVFEYAGADDVLSGTLTATAEHALHPDNHNPEGIADPTIPINIGDTVVDSIPVTTEIDLFPFPAAAGQTVYIDFQAASGTVDWKLRNPAGTVISSAANFVLSALDSGPVFLPTAGTYTIQVGGLFGSTPSYQFKLWNVPAPDAVTINLNDILNGAIETPGVADEWHFTADAGQRVYADFQQFSGGTLEARIIGPTGVVASWAQLSANLLDNGPITLPASGNYTLRINGRIDNTFTYRVQLWDVPDPDVTTIAVGDVVNGELPVPGASDEWKFVVAAGQKLYVDFQQISGGTTLETRLTNPTGGTVYTANAFLVNQLDRGPLTFTTPGTYTLHVEAAGDDTATYRFQIWNVPDDILRTIPTNEPVSGQTNSPVEKILHRFDAIAGQEYFFDVIDNPSGVQFSLLSPSGAAIFSQQTGDRLVAALPATGPYTLVATSFINGVITNGFGPFQFQMQLIAAPQIGSRDSRGTDFWLAYPPTFREIFGGVDVQLFLFLSSDVETSGTIFGTEGFFRRSFHINAGESIQVPISVGELGIGNVGRRSLRVRALDEISVYALSFMPFGSDAFMALPVDTLGTEHIIASYSGGNGLRSSQLAVVGVENGTTVTITPSVTFAGHPAGVPFSVTLNAGDTYGLESGTGLTIFQTAPDLTGTIITATKPVVVYGGHRAIEVPNGFSAANHLVDQLPPMETWGRRFVTVPLATRSNGDTYRFIAGQDGTEVRVDGVLVATLNRGQFHERVLVNRAEVVASQPILVVQYGNSSTFDNTTGDPTMLVIPPVEQFLSSYTVVAPTFAFDTNYVNVVIATSGVGSVELDGTPIDAALFQPIGTSGFAGAQVPVAPGSHHFEGPTPFGVFSYGFDVFDAYGYPGGLNLSPVAEATQIALEPATATVAIGTLQAFAATVTDDAGQPVVGVRVDFTVAGVNPGTGFAYTNHLGRAVFSYSGEFPGADTVTAAVGPLTAVANVLWSATPPTITFTSPLDGSEHRTGSFVLITGLALPGIPGSRIASVSVNGQPVDAVDVAGQFFASVQIAAGANVFDFVATDTLGQTAEAAIELVGIPGSTGGFDFDDAQDLTALAAISYSDTTFNRHTDQLHAQMWLTNLGSDPLRAPVLAVFDRITPEVVELAVAEGATPAGRPWVAFDAHLGAGGLDPASTSQPIPLRFDNPDRQRFSLDVSLLAQGNEPPAFISQPVTTAVAGIPYAYQANAIDANGDQLQYSLSSGPANMHIDPIGGLVTWTPTVDQAGAFQVEIVADDGFGGIARQQFQVQTHAAFPNRPPVIRSAPVTLVAAGADYVYQPHATDDDANELHYMLDQFPAGMTIDCETGRIEWLDAPAGTYPIALVVEDGRGGRATQTYVLTVGDGTAAAVPVITSQPPVQAVVGSLYLSLPANLYDGAGSLVFSLPQFPAGMTIDDETGEIRWIPAAGQTGLNEVTLQVDDQLGGIAIQRFAIDVAALAPNLPPVFDTLPPRYATVSESFDYLPQAHDPEGQTLTFALDEAPLAATFDPQTGRITWTPAVADVGFHRIRLRALDPAGAAALQTFFVEVRPPNSPPVFTSEEITTTVAGSAYRDLVTAFDADDAFRFSLLAGPAGMAIDPRSGLLFWRSSPAVAGPHTVSLRVTDDRGAFSDRTFTLTAEIDDQPPDVRIALSADLIDLATTPSVEINVAANDNVGVSTLVLTHNGATIPFIAGGRAIFTPPSPGLYTFVGTATDAASNVGTATRTLRVFDPNDMTPPVVEVTAPAPGAIVTYLTDIVGSVTDDNFEFYRLQLAPAGTGEWTTFFESNSEVTGGLLGVFDPTLWQRDIYDLRVFAQDVNGLQSFVSLPLSIEGQAILGNFSLTFTDLAIPLAGIPIEIIRTYDTLDAAQQGDFGYGWQLGGYDPRVRETVPIHPLERVAGPVFASNPFKMGTRVYLTNPEGRRIGFTFTPEPVAGLLGTYFNIKFTPDQGVHDQLTVLNTIPLRQDAQGGFTLCDFGFPFNPQDYVLTTKEGTRYVINQFDGLQSITDRNNNTLTFSDTGITSSAGESVEFVRDDQGRIEQLVAPDGTTIDFGYDAGGNLTSVTNQNRHITTFNYSQERVHYLAEVVDPTGQPMVRADYDPEGRLTAQTDANGHATTLIFDLEGFSETILNGLDHPTTLEYDARGNVVKETDALGRTIVRTFDADDNELTEKNQRGFTTTFTYDDRGNITSIEDPLERLTQFTYNSFSRVLTATDALGRTMTNEYDARGNLLTTTEAGLTTTFTYDALGRMESQEDPGERTTRYEYDELCDCGTPTKVINPDNSFQTFEYNEYGQTTRARDELGRITLATYDDGGRAKSVTEPSGKKTQFEYDANDRVTRLTDHLGNVSRFEYDNTGRMIREFDSRNAVTLYAYDAAGQLVEVTDRNGKVTQFVYDAVGNRTRERWLAGGSIVRELIFTFDERGNVLTASDPDSSYSFTYDPLNRALTDDNLGTPGLPRVVLTYAYDELGNIHETSDDSGVSVTSFYNDRNLPVRLEWQGGGISPVRADFDYDDDGRRTETRRYSDLAGTTLIGRSTFGYDAQGRLYDIVHRDALDAVLADYDLLYDIADQLESATHHGQTTEYDYDAAGQLTGADHTSQVDESYSYDLNGNRTSGGATIETGNRLAEDGAYEYSYDQEGNLVRRTEKTTGRYTTFDYDHRGRMVRATTFSAGGVILAETTSTYDVFDRRIATSLDSDGPGPQLPQSQGVVYNGLHAWADFDSLGNLQARYLFGDVVDELIARFRPGEGTAWHLTDHLGSVRDIVDASGVLIDHVDYDSFGRIVAESNAAAGDRFKFTGREWDPALALYYFRARFYDPHSGRFVSEDPIGFVGNDPNLYRYADNAPVIKWDSYGLATTVEKANLAKMRRILNKAKDCLAKKGVKAIISQVAVTGVYVWASGTMTYGGKALPSIAARLSAHANSLGLASRAVLPSLRLSIPSAIPGMTHNQTLLSVEQWVIDQLRDPKKFLNPQNNRNPDPLKLFKCP
jgi:RHS repeat-associated protein